MTTPQIGTKGDRLDILIRQGATFGPMQCTLATRGVYLWVSICSRWASCSACISRRCRTASSRT